MHSIQLCVLICSHKSAQLGCSLPWSGVQCEQAVLCTTASHMAELCAAADAIQLTAAAKPQEDPCPPCGIMTCTHEWHMWAELSEDDKARAIVLQPELRKLAQKLLLQHEWRESIEQSHPPGEGREAALQQLSHDLGIMHRALQTVVDVSQLASIVARGSELCRQDGGGMAPTWF